MKLPYRVSETPTPWAVRCRQQELRRECCNGGELIYMTVECYRTQINRPDAKWYCPYCLGSAVWDDANYDLRTSGVQLDDQTDKGSQVGHRTEQEAHDLAARDGLIAFVAQPNEVFIDLDKGGSLNMTAIEVLRDNNIVLSDMLRTVSKNGNTHVYYKVDHNLSDMLRIVIQACIGSDKTKELLSAIRVSQDSEAPIVLFEKPVWARKVEAWRRKS